MTILLFFCSCYRLDTCQNYKNVLNKVVNKIYDLFDKLSLVVSYFAAFRDAGAVSLWSVCYHKRNFHLKNDVLACLLNMSDV